MPQGGCIITSPTELSLEDPTCLTLPVHKVQWWPWHELQLREERLSLGRTLLDQQPQATNIGLFIRYWLEVTLSQTLNCVQQPGSNLRSPRFFSNLGRVRKCTFPGPTPRDSDSFRRCGMESVSLLISQVSPIILTWVDSRDTLRNSLLFTYIRGLLWEQSR